MIQAITGTDTEVGKTVTTAVLAARALARGTRVAIYKPAQTGVLPGQPGDVQDAAGWLGHPERLGTAEGVRLREPMAPLDAARCAGFADPAEVLPPLAEHVRRIRELAAAYDEVLVEGAGGLLVELTSAGETIADLAAALSAELVVVTRPELGTLNHTALTLEACAVRGFSRGTLVLGSYPDRPTQLAECNLAGLRTLATRYGWSFAGRLPANLVRDPARRPEALAAAAHALAPTPA
ncbi:dethiobiotin synthase [Arthrobacter sp. MYb211]|uniref:dethiobiotin synthase n=1 Tax=Micrococcaceae TaxID=1268 RepID=UPI000BB74398|nr:MULTISPECIES: dethiobiotin synthase [Micrococcaceae]PCC27928.1 dethiobiotin synthase [Glutamicibacter sp. BW80]PRA13268.1 dethiobiotin synthase [Arthrobacter sp. MYb221]PRC10464.1 dethiobiotin synthase [Arthrobacter sp. MYb211]